ncbi:TonB-dependent receptor [Fulvivirgaceae bacterium PWU4]|uniref:TonB-dependent receptor n=1 Tax=Chryseosolibacter histidini TaxID=2782349 RepID=A0AAP2GR09_9BACT|nr:TonB-dependent receptor [Chryseosolibacter histidini]MBT1700688.1 TonB-dependent receptor [Chryseosolibacter histidini]
MKKNYRGLNRLASVFLFLFVCSVAFAQQRLITGKITDEAGSPLPGVNIVLKGTSSGTTTDVDGNFGIQATETDVLSISFIGYEPQEVRVGNLTVVNIKLAEDIKTLQEVVVIGYGEVKKSDLTGAVVSVKGETINQSVTTGIDQGLIGRVAGITATQMSGQPGGSVSIRIRGTSSVNGDTEPLYVIDGVPISGNNRNVYEMGLGAVGGAGKTTYSPLSTINPSDIESIEILKDASATAIYGNRGSNGVVIITTKRGKKGEAKVAYDGYYGVQQAPVKMEMMNLREYAEFRNDWAAETAGETPDPMFADPSVLGEGTDWQKEIFRTAPVMNHQLTLSGGDKTRYVITGGYFKQDGMILGSNFDRYSLRVNLDTDVKKWLTVGNSLAVSKTDERLGVFDRGGIIGTALKARPDVPARNFDGSYAGVSSEGAFVNPLAQALDKKNYLKRATVIGNVYADLKFLPSLTLRSEFGGNAELNNSSSWNPTYNYGGGAVNEHNSISRQSGQSYFWQVKNYLTFNQQFANVHNVTAMLGQEASSWGWYSVGATGRDLPTNDVHSIDLGDPKQFTAADASNSGALESYYGRLNYNFNEKYYATFTYRADGSGNFGPGHKWGYFPSAALSWRLTSEPFLQNIKTLSNLKLRASWGKTGNAGNQGGFKYGETLATLPTNLGLGFRYTNYGNPLITWESSEQVDVGVDAAFLENRISLTFEYYRKLTSDLLLVQQLPGYMGTIGNDAVKREAPWGNFGELENKGFEIQVSSKNLTGKFQWDTDLNITRNRNTLLDLGIKDAFLSGNIGASGNVLVSRTLNGQPLGNFYGYKVVGIFKDKEDILNSPVQWDPKNDVGADGQPIFSRDGTVWPGDLKFADIDKNDTIDTRDRVNLGSPQPKFSFGFNNTFRYGGFSLEIFLVGVYGNKIFNAMKNPNGSGLAAMRSAWDNQLKEVTNRAKLEPINAATDGWWNDINNVRVSNPNTDIPRATFSDPNENTRVSSRYIEDGSYLRIRNIRLGYTLPASLISRIKASNVYVYAQVQNAYTFTKYSGFDPEVGQDTWDRNLFGVDNGRYPSPRMYTVGLSLGF